MVTNTSYICSSVLNDEFSLFLAFMLFFVVFCSYAYSYNLNPYSTLSFILMLITLFCFFMFSTNSMFYMYLSYEGSLIPILYIIIKWGSYPERSLRAIMLLVYTSVFTFPFIYVLFYLFSSTGSYMFSIIPYSAFELSGFFTFLAFITFAVKLPIYGVHF